MLAGAGALAALQPPSQQTAAAASVVLGGRPPPPGPGPVGAALRSVAPRLSETDRASWVTILHGTFCQSAISEPRCVAAFLGQCAAESGGFRVLEEDLDYTASRLCAVWPSHFPDEAVAAQCAGQPERLANVVYAGRLGNGDAASGDGWRFRGRGLIQITGRTAYQRFARTMRMTLDQAVAHAATAQGAADSAAWFWCANGLNALAQSWSIETLTRRINGGLEGTAERARLCEAALQAVSA